jgi:hypothetical protein
MALVLSEAVQGEAITAALLVRVLRQVLGWDFFEPTIHFNLAS